MVDPELVARIGALRDATYSGEAWRHLDPSRDPLSGAGARLLGGRWNPPESFAVLYLGLALETVNAEFLRMASRQGRRVADFLPRRLCKYEVELDHLAVGQPVAAADLPVAGDARAGGVPLRVE